MPTIIDSLVVVFNANFAPYTNAVNKQRAAQKAAKEQLRKDGNEIGDTLSSVATKAAGLLLGFEGLKGAFEYFGNLNVANAQLGRFAANLGSSAHEVNAWDQAVELAGGSAKDAENDVSGLSQSITDLHATGSVSPLLLLFQRMNIALTDGEGKARKYTDLFKDLGDHLRQYNRADAFNLARAAGLSDSTFNLIIQERAERDRLLATAEANNKVTEDTVRQAAKLQEEWREIGQEAKGVWQTVSTNLAPAIQSTIDGSKSFVADVKSLVPALQPIVDTFKTISGYVDSIAAKFPTLSGFAKTVASPGSFIIDTIKKLAEAKRQVDADAAKPKQTTFFQQGLSPRQGVIDRGGGVQASGAAARNNPGNLRFANQPGATNTGGFASFPTLAQGIQQANRQLDLYSQRGLNTISKIISKWAPSNENDTATYIAQISKFLGKGANEELSAQDRQKLLQGIFNKEGSNKVSPEVISSSLGPNLNALSAARYAANTSLPGATSILGAPSAGSSTDVDIDQINIYTQATDARGIAAEIPGALKRKGVIAQVDTGQS